MSSRTSYLKYRSTQPLNRRHLATSNQCSKFPTYDPDLGSVEISEADQQCSFAARTSYLTTTKAANYLHKSKQYLGIARQRGDGPPFIKLSRAVRYHRPSLDPWMLERQRNHTAEGEV